MQHQLLPGLTTLPTLDTHHHQMLELQNYYNLTAPTVIPQSVSIPTPTVNVLPVAAAPVNKKILTRSSSKISNITNNTDKDSINSRIFVGNLNTFVITKDDVEAIFQRYGPLEGISMHKGYAFIQYKCEQDARNAVKGEDQRVYATQALDVNMAAEPKPNRPSRKRPHSMIGKSCIEASNLLRGDLNGLGTLMNPLSSSPTLMYVPTGAPLTYKPHTPLKVDDKNNGMKHHNGKIESRVPEPATCGTCKKVFSDGKLLKEHKTQGCPGEEEVICHCSKVLDNKALACATCNEEFRSSWELLQHCQYVHQISIFIDKQDQEAINCYTDKASPNVS